MAHSACSVCCATTPDGWRSLINSVFGSLSRRMVWRLRLNVLHCFELVEKNGPCLADAAQKMCSSERLWWAVRQYWLCMRWMWDFYQNAHTNERHTQILNPPQITTKPMRFVQSKPLRMMKKNSIVWTDSFKIIFQNNNLFHFPTWKNRFSRGFHVACDN